MRPTGMFSQGLFACSLKATVRIFRRPRTASGSSAAPSRVPGTGERRSLRPPLVHPAGSRGRQCRGPSPRSPGAPSPSSQGRGPGPRARRRLRGARRRRPPTRGRHVAAAQPRAGGCGGAGPGRAGHPWAHRVMAAAAGPGAEGGAAVAAARHRGRS